MILNNYEKEVKIMKKLYVFIAILLCTLMSCNDIIDSDNNIKKEKIIIMDIDSNEYKIVPICGKKWMAENLKVRHYRNGDPITHAVTQQEWIDANEKKEGAWCYFANNPENGEIYGILYNWYAVNDIRGLAPDCCHVPTREEYNNLFQCLGGLEMAGGKLKSTKTSEKDNGGWRSPNTGATDKFGFCALPGGKRDGLMDMRSDFFFLSKEYIGYWWTSSAYNDNYPDMAHYFSLHYNSEGVSIFGSSHDYKVHGYSVRCVMD